MKKILMISIIVLSMISTIVLASKIMQEEASGLGKNYKIAGVIRDTQGNKIENSRVELIGTSNSNTASMQEGEFSYQNLPEGKYQLKITYDMDQYEVDNIVKKKQEVYSLQSDYSICFLYPQGDEGIHSLVEELANKLRYISYSNGMKSLKIYEATYQGKEDLEEATEKVMQDVKHKKLIVAFASNQEFIEQCKEKQKALSVQPNLKISVPYQILGIGLQENIKENIDGLYENFFMFHQGELEKESILERIYSMADQNIMKISPYREETEALSVQEEEGSIQTEEIIIGNNHDNDTTNSMEVVLRKKTQEEMEREEQKQNQNQQQEQWQEEIASQPTVEPIEVVIDTVVPSDIEGETKKVDVVVQKHVKAMRLVLADGSILIETKDPDDSWWSMKNLKVISLDEELMHGATIYIEYGLEIENKSDSGITIEEVTLLDCLNYQYDNHLGYDSKATLLTNATIQNETYHWQWNPVGDKMCLKATVQDITDTNTISLLLSKVISAEKDEMYYENHVFLEKLTYGYFDEDGNKQTKSVTINSDMTQEKIENHYIQYVQKSETIMIIPPTGRRMKE